MLFIEFSYYIRTRSIKAHEKRDMSCAQGVYVTEYFFARRTYYLCIHHSWTRSIRLWWPNSYHRLLHTRITRVDYYYYGFRERIAYTAMIKMAQKKCMHGLSINTHFLKDAFL